MQITSAVAKAVLILLFSLAASGCANPKYAKEMEDSGRSLIFGYIDTKGSEMYLSRVYLAPNEPGKKKDYMETRLLDTDDAFYLENVKRGSYRLDALSGIYYSSGMLSTFPESGPGAYTFKIDKPGLYFVGAYKYKIIPISLVKRTFELVPLTSPTQKDILQKILPYTKGKKWEALIRKRIREL